MLLQLLFLVAIWGGIYVLREQAQAIKKALEKTAIEGKWQSIRAPEITLSLSEKYFRLSRDGKVFRSGEYSGRKTNFRSRPLVEQATRATG